ncbi:helix-turn-helix transcriptional regulator [Acerihabitans sp. TG2]|uniref:helix-turn-helix transcriptional regulator n=1 Tax=Acerihabitans sp. TG2 TaxID=3096008 RepID=UPI002B23B80A|nr:helix-turn-helix transcriptional regulator [Acerihabitans sp. TG2]MEA9393642.1 helix-turn-helix transcriptional regulator [Acerihabitans sp. TG2]
MNVSIGNNIDIRSKDFGALISYMQNSNEYWYINDHEHRGVFLNDYGFHYSGLPKGFNPEGKLLSEYPVYWSDHAEVIRENDKHVMTSQKTIRTLFNAVYGGKEKLIQPFMINVSPLIENGKSIGVVGHAKKLDIFSMYHLELGRGPASLQFGNPTDLFTDREFDVVFYAMQSLSAKDIARRLAISPNTVKKYLLSVYEKVGVSALSQLIEYCRCHGYDNYAPSRFMSTEPHMPLAEFTK